MRLPLARPENATSVLPSQKSLMAAMELAKYSSEAANYLLQAAKVLLSKAGLQDQSKPLLDELEKFRNNVDMKSVDSNKLWGGVIVAASRVMFEFDNLQKHLAAQAATRVGKNDIFFDYAVSKEADFVRGYSSSDGKTLDEESVSGMDTLS